jgi:hypothetical protein
MTMFFLNPKNYPHKTYWSFDTRLEQNPFICRPYRYSYFKKTEIESIVEELLNQAVIRPSQSPYAAPVLLVKKKDGYLGETYAAPSRTYLKLESISFRRYRMKEKSHRERLRREVRRTIRRQSQFWKWTRVEEQGVEFTILYKTLEVKIPEDGSSFIEKKKE